MIEACDLEKKYGEITAVNHVSFTADRGQIFGMLGPNGAGKTTTLRMLYGLHKPSSGKVIIDGIDVHKETQKAQTLIGALPDGDNLYTRLTAKENIEYFGRLHGLNKKKIHHHIDEYCERLHMENIINRRTQGFSQGERMKVALCRALIHNPDYIFLDEPTNGLDVLATRSVRELLLDLKQENKCIIFSSHLMHEVDKLCDTVGVISRGVLVKSGTLDNIIAESQTHTMEDAFIHYAYTKKQREEIRTLCAR